ncbi:putative membrane protein [Halolamina pelagica]|uniref:Putative membrane protein n=1 Tax=Halolamina pelagica TaxID=699431 RepID=A0A0P7HX92_9EURY|nr:putative membrane protein [Halolamina pelagica]
MTSFARRLFRRLFNRQFRPADVAQQIVGGFLLAGPFVVTEEVWVLAGVMGPAQWAVTVTMVFAIGWGHSTAPTATAMPTTRRRSPASRIGS